jgi:hypothetical protein
MSDSLNGEIRKQEAVGPAMVRLLRDAVVITVSIVAFSVLYAGMLLLAIGGYMVRMDSQWRSRRFSAT